MTKNILRHFAQACLLIAALVIPKASFADPQIKLFTASSDAFSQTMKISLTVNNDSDATAFIYNVTGDQTIPLTDLAKGIVLYQYSGKNVATLQSSSFDPKTGGPLTLTYIKDGLKGTYGTYNLELIRQGSNWAAAVPGANGVPQFFTQMYLTANKMLGQIVGVKSISVK